MKNILIPTSLEDDTVGAVAAAIKHAASECCTIVLLLFSEAPDAYSTADYINRVSPGFSLTNNNLTLKRCRTLIAAARHCNLQVHHQYGISAPLMRNMLNVKAIDMVVLPESFKKSSKKIYSYCTRLLLKSRYPILLPGAAAHRSRLSNALYLEHPDCSVAHCDVEAMVNDNFPYKVVSYACISHMQSPETLKPLLAETIFKNDIDVVIATRNPERKDAAKNGNENYDSILGLPVLSLCEVLRYKN